MLIRLLLSLCVLFTLSAHAKSIDCPKATSEIDKTICKNHPLKLADWNLDTAYTQLKKTYEFEEDKYGLEQLHASQHHWILGRNKCQTIECILSSYQKRQEALVQLTLDKGYSSPYEKNYLDNYYKPTSWKLKINDNTTYIKKPASLEQLSKNIYPALIRYDIDNGIKDTVPDKKREVNIVHLGKIGESNVYEIDYPILGDFDYVRTIIVEKSPHQYLPVYFYYVADTYANPMVNSGQTFLYPNQKVLGSIMHCGQACQETFYAYVPNNLFAFPNQVPTYLSFSPAVQYIKENMPKNFTLCEGDIPSLPNKIDFTNNSIQVYFCKANKIPGEKIWEDDIIGKANIKFTITNGRIAFFDYKDLNLHSDK
jgi:uncharacterized protein